MIKDMNARCYKKRLLNSTTVARWLKRLPQRQGMKMMRENFDLHKRKILKLIKIHIEAPIKPELSWTFASNAFFFIHIFVAHRDAVTLKIASKLAQPASVKSIISHSCALVLRTSAMRGFFSFTVQVVCLLYLNTNARLTSKWRSNENEPAPSNTAAHEHKNYPNSPLAEIFFLTFFGY